MYVERSSRRVDLHDRRGRGFLDDVAVPPCCRPSSELDSLICMLLIVMFAVLAVWVVW